MFFAHPEDDQLFGVTVKDSDTCGYSFYIYRCSVKDFECVVSFITVITKLFHCAYCPSVYPLVDLWICFMSLYSLPTYTPTTYTLMTLPFVSLSSTCKPEIHADTCIICRLYILQRTFLL